MKEIKLNKGMVALVDNEDYEQLNKHKWYAKKGCRGTFYAARTNYASRVRPVRMGRQILGLDYNDGQLVDHKNRNTLDNRKSNLQIVIRSQTQMHQKIRIHSSRYKGVHWQRASGKWVATITKNYKSRHLGIFRNEIYAGCAYDEAAKKLFGKYARLNFEDE